MKMGRGPLFRHGKGDKKHDVPSFQQIKQQLAKQREADAGTDRRIRRGSGLIRKLDKALQKQRLADFTRRILHELRHPVKVDIERQLQRLKKVAAKRGVPWPAVEKVCLLKPEQLKAIRKETRLEIKLIDYYKHNKTGRHVIGELLPVRERPPKWVDDSSPGFPDAQRLVLSPIKRNTARIVYHFRGMGDREFQQGLGFELTVIIDGKGSYQLNTRYGKFIETIERDDRFGTMIEREINFEEMHPLKSQRERAERLVATFRKMTSI